MEEQKKNKGGRPEINEKRLRTPWGFTALEMEAIRSEFAKTNEKNIGAFVYKKVLNRPIETQKPVNFPDELKRDFKTLGNNINQIAVALHSKKTEPLSTEMLQKLDLISRQYTFLVQRLQTK